MPKSPSEKIVPRTAGSSIGLVLAGCSVFISCFSGEGFTAVFTNIPPEIAVVKARGNIALENLDLIIQTLPFFLFKTNE